MVSEIRKKKNNLVMNYSFSVNLHDRDGDKFDDGVFAHIGDNTIIKFKDIDELEKFANDILGSLEEIRENYL